MGLYEFYEHRVFPHMLDVAMRPFVRYRIPALAEASGKVLEIGFGTGLNLPCYPTAVTDLTTVDPMTAVPRALQQRLDAARFPVHRHPLTVDGGLPFDSHSFDCVTVTWTMCSVADPVAGLREMLRVLRPGAPLLFVEHGRSDNPRTQRWQERLNGTWQILGCGCHLNRAMDEIIEVSGFRIDKLRRFDAPGVPRTHGHLYLGKATAPR
jgi:ubiquinone/menaquinone biosynthesis C-methylase UbiE